jgi:uncharacterized membrane protein (DUF4010 family)
MNIPLLFTILSSLWLGLHIAARNKIKKEPLYIRYAWKVNCTILSIIDILSIIQLCGINGHFMLMFSVIFMLAFVGSVLCVSIYIYYKVIMEDNKPTNNTNNVVTLTPLEGIV